MGDLGDRRRVLLRWPVPVCAALLLAGCASMPSGGEVRKVGDGQPADADSQVRVVAIAPHPGESASEIVTGFLEATTSSESDFATAKKYLSKDLSRRWNPFSQITVFNGAASSKELSGTGRKEGFTTVDLSGTKTGVVDAKHAFQPEQGDFNTSFNLVKQNNEWRISDLDDGLVLSELDFKRIYHSVNMYYFADQGSDAQRTGDTRKTLVADLVYLRNQTDSLVSTVTTLLGGPTTWLAPVVTPAIPGSVRLYEKAADHGVTLDDSQHLKVRLNTSAQRLGGERCVNLAAQLFATVQAQASAKLAAVDVRTADDSTACSLSRAQAQTYGPENLLGSSSRQYYIGSAPHRLLELPVGDATANGTPVSGPFGGAKADLQSVAVRRDEQMAAGVKTNGRQLMVASLTEDVPFGEPVLTSKATDPKNGLSAPSWDGFNDLWIADRDPLDSRVVLLRNGSGSPSTVSVPGLSGRVESLRVASDGVRIALVVRQSDGLGKLQLGRIERGGTLEHPKFSVTGLRTLTPEDEGVTSVSWAGQSRLVVLGRPSGGVQQIQYINTDGSANPALDGISEASSVAASEDQNRALLASYDRNVYRLPLDSSWEKVAPKGDGPVYPG